MRTRAPSHPSVLSVLSLLWQNGAELNTGRAVLLLPLLLLFYVLGQHCGKQASKQQQQTENQAEAVASLVQAKTPFWAEVRMSNILTMAFKTVKEPALTVAETNTLTHAHTHSIASTLAHTGSDICLSVCGH